MIRSCATRALKVARHLQLTRPDILPAEEPLEGFASILEGSDPTMRYLLRDALAPGKLPTVSGAVPGPLYSGTLAIVRVSFQTRKGAYAVAVADAAATSAYLTFAAPAIARYCGQYGTTGLSVGTSVVDYSVSLPNGQFNDSMLQGWVNDLVARGRLPAGPSAPIFLAPPGVLNTDADPSRGVLGYHGFATIPYAFVNVLGTGFTVEDPHDQFALAVSHEVAELTVDPRADGSNPEVCDPCGPNCQPPLRAYFDAAGAYLTTEVPFPPNLAYRFFLNAIVQPGSATACPAPVAACAYSPPRA